MSEQITIKPTFEFLPDWFNSRYEVTQAGKIISLKFGKKNEIKELKCNRDSHGYLFVRLYNKDKGKNYWISRLVAKAFLPNPENKPQVNHKDGNPLNNNVNNLEWVTAKENTLHAYRTGLRKSTKGMKFKNTRKHNLPAIINGGKYVKK